MRRSSTLSKLKLHGVSALALGCALGLSACATAPAHPTPAKAVAVQPPVDVHSPYGLFVAGEAALNDDSAQAAADYFVDAGHEDVEPLIGQKAFLAAIAAGDIDRAAALTSGIDDSSAGMARLSQLVRAVSALAAGRNKDAYLAMAKEPDGFAYVGGYQLIKPWVELAGGDNAHAATLPDTQGQRLNRMAAVLSRSLIDERLHRYDEAEAGYKVLVGSAQLGTFYVQPYGAYLERRGRGKDAEALYRKFLARTPGDRGLKDAIARVEARKPAPPMPTLKEGAGGALISAAELALVEKAVDEGEIYLQMGLKLDPTNDSAWLLLGDLRASAGRNVEAREDYARISPDAPSALEARERIITTYENTGDDDTALTLARDLVKAAPDQRDTQLVLADALRDKGQYQDSAKILSAVIDADPANAGWTLYFLRGTALSESGDWPDAEADLLKALSLKPDQPDVLNYLGYTWVEKGERLQQAMAMLLKAANAEPESGEIADSLGWAYYHLGDYHAAVLNLERAVTFNAVSPEINDHLGDAYWQVGRRAEAQFQWRRVLSLQPTAELKASAEKKLSSGLDAPAPRPAAIAQG
ncbi:MAG TPA: tetratricopeptide repeat protein [Caulobacteraceae bacterium]|nr:tetratricopeptide repeat protein [Caulobacteraceae bacterium]